jgi:hypothetical protein
MEYCKLFCIWNMCSGILQTVLYLEHVQWNIANCSFFSECLTLYMKALPARATSRTTPQTHGGPSLKTAIVEPLLRVASRSEGIQNVLVGRQVSLRYVSRRLKDKKDATSECAVNAALV